MSTSSGEQGMTAQARFVRRILTELAIMTVIGVFLAVIGPFGSIEEPLPVRLVVWLGFAYVGYAIYSPMGFLVERAHRALDLPRGPLWFVAALIATVPMSAVVYLVGYFPDWPPVPSLESALTNYFYVFVIGGGVTLLFNVLGTRSDDTPDEAEGIPDRVEAAVVDQSAAVQSAVSEATSLSNPLLDQLPADIGTDVIALEMQDHYVRVHTALGSELVLMRLRDAMIHLSNVEGKQVHRSWWVARLAVEDVRREGRNIRLVLPRGIEAPVSRAQVNELKEAGWI